MQILAVACLSVGVIGVAAFVAYCFAAWLDSRETHIEPIVSKGARK
jgi:hypothetical protein